MGDEKVNPPPLPSVPKEAPWKEIEAILDAINRLSAGIAILNARLGAAPPAAAPGVVPPAAVVPIVAPDMAQVLAKLVEILDRLNDGEITHVKVGYPFAMVQLVSAIVLDEDSNRRFALLINDSDNDIYLALGRDAKLNEGILLTPHGGFFEVCFNQHYTGRIFGITSVADQRLLITDAT